MTRESEAVERWPGRRSVTSRLAAAVAAAAVSRPSRAGLCVLRRLVRFVSVAVDARRKHRSTSESHFGAGRSSVERGLACRPTHARPAPRSIAARLSLGPREAPSLSRS